MKKSIIAFVAASTLIGSSCGTLGTSAPAPAPAQQTSQTGSDLGNILGNLSGIGDIISSTPGITTKSIVGTWVYQQPAVLFESDNFLTKAGGQIAAQSLSKKLYGYFQKVGIKPGKVTMTFDKSGNFTQTIGGKTQQKGDSDSHHAAYEHILKNPQQWHRSKLVALKKRILSSTLPLSLSLPVPLGTTER